MSESGDGSQPSDTMRERADVSSTKLWLLVEVNRWVVAGALLAVVFVSMVALGVADPSPLERAVAVSDPNETLFQGFVTAIITGVTLVVTLNQLVLSQELAPIGEQRERMEEALGFREDVEATLATEVSPPEPDYFLRVLVETARDRATDLSNAVGDDCDERLRDEVDDFADDVTGNAEEVIDQLEDTKFGSFAMLSAVLDFNYSWKIFVARRIRKQHADELNDEARAAFEELADVLELFGPAREHFKTLYFRWELVNLSRVMLYSAVPALIVVAAMIIYYDARAIPGATFGVSNDVLVTSLATTVAVTPFMLLLSYILRIATIAKRTLSIGPFVLREVDRNEKLERE